MLPAAGALTARIFSHEKSILLNINKIARERRRVLLSMIFKTPEVNAK